MVLTLLSIVRFKPQLGPHVVVNLSTVAPFLEDINHHTFLDVFNTFHSELAAYGPNLLDRQFVPGYAKNTNRISFVVVIDIFQGNVIDVHPDGPSILSAKNNPVVLLIFKASEAVVVVSSAGVVINGQAGWWSMPIERGRVSEFKI